jgi:MFS superfamily sulfate permease-like transporter
MAIVGLFVTGVGGGAILFSILPTRQKVHPVFIGLVLGIVFGVPAMLISAHASETAMVDPALRAVWILVAFLAWGAILGRAGQRLIGIETANSTVEHAAEPRVERIDRRHFLVKLGGSAAAITVVGALVGEFADAGEKKRR